jgi:hypothetical protein
VSRTLRVAAAAVGLALLSGCYHVGYHSVGDRSVIAVPIFENKTLRRGYEYLLTEHLRRRILDQTPLQLGHESSCSAVLKGSITSVRQGVVIPTVDTQPPLEGSVSITIEVSLVDRETNKLLAGADTDGDGIPDGPATLTESETFISAYDQTVDTAADRALKKLAERIVDLIEDRWGNQSR